MDQQLADLFKTVITSFSGLAGVALGAWLVEMQRRARVADEDRRLLMRAFAELLQLRHMVARDIEGDAVLMRFAPFPPEVLKEIRRQSWEVLRLGDLQASYAAAVEALSPVDPILAFKLRGKEAMLRYAARVDEMDTDPLPFEDARRFVIAGLREFLKDIEESLRAMAKRIGGDTPSQVEAIFAKKAEMPTEMASLMQELLKGQVSNPSDEAA